MSYTGGTLASLADPDLARHATRDMADVGGDWLLVRVIDNTPVSYHGVALAVAGLQPARTPGTLKRSWKRGEVELVTEGTSDGFAVDVETHDPVAPFVEWDTQPHLIKPKLPGGVLVFRTWPTGELVHTKLVKHPGTRGQHMVAFAVHAAELAFEEIVGPTLHRWRDEQLAKVVAH